MIPDIFSTFDPYMSRTFIPVKTLFLLFLPIFILILTSFIFTLSNRNLSIVITPLKLIFSQLQRTSSTYLKGMSLIVTSLFIFIIVINLAGIIPYTFRLSRHLIISLSFALPLWLRLIVSSFFFKPKNSTAHFLPDGAPDWLNPFLVLIETTRIIVRPLTLSFRLAANITAGHIVLSLLGIYLSSRLILRVTSSLVLLFASSFYIIFELAICLIQAYIFCLLVSLYRDDHA